MDIEKYLDKAIDVIVSHGPGIVAALVVLIIGLWIVGRIVNVAKKLMEKRGVDPSLRPFLGSLISVGLKAMLLISVAEMVGIETTSFVALIGAAGLAIGLALQGTLANFAGGVLILLFKPYKVGNLIEAQGHIGVVKEIQIFVTILLSPENKTIIIPNGAISNGDITNYTTAGKIRVDLTMGIAYDADIKTAKETLIKIMENHPKVLKDPAPFVGVAELADSSVNLAVRPFCEPENYWDVYFDIYEQGKEALDAANITIPFPQLDVHLEKQ
ncbi:MAG: mechanosensitive ion channel family protein [Salibacteraceae bacterium]